MILADDAFGQMFFKVQDGLQLVLHHPAHGNARPVADDAGHGLMIDDGQDEGVLALKGLKFRVLRVKLFDQLGPFVRRERAGFDRLGILGLGRIHRSAPARKSARSFRMSATTAFLGVPSGR